MKPVRDDPNALRIIEQELRLLARVTGALSAASSEVAGAPDFNDALLNLRDQIAEAKPEDIGPLVEQMMRISAIAQRYGRGRDLPVNPESPYFAHMRLLEGETRRDVLIGKRGYIDRPNQIQIVDWRNAPVSRIYYRYEEGDDFDESVGRTQLEGVVEIRRSVTIESGRLRRITAPQGTFICDASGAWHQADERGPAELRGGQGTAARPPALARGDKGSQLGGPESSALRGDKHLPEIAALIDPEQFKLITRPESGLVLLQGGAGSGKTTVALHRVAYLNFAMPGRFRPDRMLVVVLSEAMVRYVRRVLPSLGVKGVQVTTAASWFRRTRHRVVPSAYDRYNDDTPAGVLRMKKHPVMLELLKDYVAQQLRRMERQLDSALQATPDGEAVLARWRDLASQPPVGRVKALQSWLRQSDAELSALTLQRAQTVTRTMLRRLRDLVADWSEVLTDRNLLLRALERGGVTELGERHVDELCRWCAHQSEEVPAGEPRRKKRRRAGGAPMEQSDSAPYISLDGQDERDNPVAGRLDPPDDALLLRLAQLKTGTLQPPSGKPIRLEHVVVDEAQDLCATELKVLLSCRSRMGSATVAGDVSQRLAFDNAFTTWEEMLERLGTPAATNTTLRLGYRSTEQIMALARHLVADETGAAGQWSPQRGGAAVELFSFNDRGEAVAHLAGALRSLVAREPLASVACIARFPAQARLYAESLTLAEVPNVRLVAGQDFSFRPGVEVTDVAKVKGLEFDYVVLLDVTSANYPPTQESRHMLYIGATRAAHQLWLLSPGLPSPVLPAEL